MIKVFSLNFLKIEYSHFNKNKKMNYLKESIDIINLVLTITFNFIVILQIHCLKEDNNIKQFSNFIYWQAVVAFLSGIVIYVLKLHIFIIKGYFVILFDFFDTIIFDLTLYRIFYSNSTIMLIMISSLILFFIINYILVIILYIKYHLYMKEYNSIMSNHTKRMHREFNRLLLLQSVIPTFIIGIPVLYYVICLLLQNYEMGELFGTTIQQILSTVCYVNPLLYLVVIIYKLTKCNFKYLGGINVVGSDSRNMG
uniref:G_PROTEIN_RECEP_F1_2 domain-containing protein n=1 Tax=Strongyloides papillosus TaxID=174720 RepID=A0A0N5C2T1_STREA